MGAQLGGERTARQFVIAEAGVWAHGFLASLRAPFRKREWRDRPGLGRLRATLNRPHTMSTSSPGIQARHQQALDEGRFLIQRCGSCAKHIYFPRELCPHCGALAPALVAPSGLGTVHAVTTIKRKPEAGGDYNVCLVDLDEGVRLMSRVEGIALADVKVGLRVRARVAVTEGKGLVVFDVEQAA